MTNRIEGPYGTADPIPVPGIPGAAETVCTWLLTAPQAHPLWSQYMLGVVRLRDLPGFPPPKRQFTGATHELFVVALNPEHGPMTAKRMERAQRTGRVPLLFPVSIVHQIEGTDDEARGLAGQAAAGVVHGILWPETGDAPEASWKTSLVKGLAHIRGEVHAP